MAPRTSFPPPPDCTALTAPATFTTGVIATFTHTGLALAANTNYVVVVTQRGTASVELNTTTSSGEDTSLGLSDWSIKNKFYWQSGSTWMLKSGANEALRIIVSGYANTGRVRHHRRDAERPVGERRDAQPGVRRGHDDLQRDGREFGDPGHDHRDEKRVDGDGRVSRQLGRHADGRRHHDRRPPGQPQRGQQHRQGEGDRARHNDHGDLHRQRGSRPCPSLHPASTAGRIWSANLTAEELIVATNVLFIGYTSPVGTLSDTTFDLAGTSYTVSALAIEEPATNNELGITLNANPGSLNSHLTLHLGSDSFSFADATVRLVSGFYSFKWTGHGLSWADNDAICLALTVDGPAVSSVALTSAPGTDNTYAIGDDRPRRR